MFSDVFLGEPATKLTFESKSFFFLHTINAFEDKSHLVIDISCYDNPDMVYCMNIADLQTAQSNPDYGDLFKGRPHRFVLPLKPKTTNPEQNLVELTYTNAKAFIAKSSKKKIRVVSQRICDVGCETPTIYYEKY